MDYTPVTFSMTVLQRMGIRPTRQNVQAIVGWIKAEGGHWNNSARHNPLNTTRIINKGEHAMNGAGVKSYRSWEDGIRATLETLRLPAYRGIVANLRSNNPMGVANAIESSPWGTGGLAKSTIPSTHIGHLPNLPDGGQPAQPQQRTTTTTTSTGYQEQARRQAAAEWLMSKDKNPLTLAANVVAAQDAAPQDTTTTTSTSPAPRERRSGGANRTIPTNLHGTATFEGHRVAAWIKPALEYGRRHGWKGTINSGFRTYEDQVRIYNSGVRPAAKPGTSNHEGSDFPRGAVDVSDAATLSRILSRSPYGKYLKYAGAKDPVHFSHPHNGSY